MPTPLPLGLLDIEILTGYGRYEAGTVLEFRDDGEAYRFLRGLLDSPRHVDAMRAALASTWPGRDFTRAGAGELLVLLAREVGEGRLRIAARPPRRVMDVPFPRKQAGAASQSPAPAPASEAEGEPAPAEAAPA